jgi:hypothetical protein
MLPRECDNDACDEEVVVGEDGVPRNVWVHASECDGLVLPPLPHPDEVRKGSFLAYLMASPFDPSRSE